MINRNIFAALVHYPVYNKKGDIVATSVTTLDVHDTARISKTYDLGGVYLVTPLEAHRQLIDRLFGHWVDGHGAEYNPTRKEAFHKLSVADSIEGAIAAIEKEIGKRPKVIATGAKSNRGSIDYDAGRRLVNDGDPYLILFGTGWGLTSEVMSKVDYILDPIDAGTGYNHLPVRAAFAIIFDRILGR